MSEDKLANINGEELRKEIEILFEDKERRVFFMQMLATSVKETNELLNVVTLVLESPEILQNPESKMKICEFLKKHKGIIADLSECFYSLISRFVYNNFHFFLFVYQCESCND